MSFGGRFGSPYSRDPQELLHLQDKWWWFLLLGVLLVAGGVVALAYPFYASVGTLIVIGTVLIIGGVANIIASFFAGKWSAFLIQLLAGTFYVIAGVVIRDTPLEATAVMTLFIAAFFMAVGAFRAIAALVERFSLWGWALLNGAVTFMIGMVIYDAFPRSALWAIGILIGLELAFNGWTWIMLSLVIQRACRHEGTISSSSSSGHYREMMPSSSAGYLKGMMPSSSSSGNFQEMMASSSSSRP